MKQSKLYFRNSIKPLNNKYTYINEKLINLKWYEVRKRIIYLKLKKKYRKMLDKHLEVYIDKVLFEIANKPLTEEEEKNVKESVSKAIEKIYNEENKKD